MRYIDTRGKAPHANFNEVLLAGTAPGGGLYVPETYPKIDLTTACRMEYPELASYVMYPFVEGCISFEDLDDMTHSIYNEKVFGTKEVTPIRWLQHHLGLLQLSNGPTMAFKDLAMKMVARLMDHVLEKQNRRVAVVVSTSGDTGGAAVEAFRGLDTVDLVVLFPEGRVSRMQQLMMTTADAANVHAIAIKGTFDDCQAMTKALFDDKALCEKYGLSGVNSINWARIMAQVVYWVFCGAQVLNRGAKEFIVSVPSGNFGDALSAHIAREMGVPIRTIIVATNQNDVLDRVFKTGIYQKADAVLPSSSPSMDIQVASNFERFLFDVAERDGTLIDTLYEEFKKTGRLDVQFLMSRLGHKWTSGCAQEDDVDFMIRRCYQKYGVIIDPHTAVGLCIGLKHYKHEGLPVVVAETAKPQKFPDVIKRATGVDLSVPEAWKQLETLPEHVTQMEADPEKVKEFIAEYVG